MIAHLAGRTCDSVLCPYGPPSARLPASLRGVFSWGFPPPHAPRDPRPAPATAASRSRVKGLQVGTARWHTHLQALLGIGPSAAPRPPRLCTVPDHLEDPSTSGFPQASSASLTCGVGSGCLRCPRGDPIQFVLCSTCCGYLAATSAGLGAALPRPLQRMPRGGVLLPTTPGSSLRLALPSPRQPAASCSPCFALRPLV